MACAVMAYKVLAYAGMAYMVMAYVVMARLRGGNRVAHIVMALYSYDPI